LCAMIFKSQNGVLNDCEDVEGNGFGCRLWFKFFNNKSHRVTTIEWVNCMQILIEVGMCLTGHKSKRGLHKVWYKCWGDSKMKLIKYHVLC
jgi:hypothetical protein